MNTSPVTIPVKQDEPFQFDPARYKRARMKEREALLAQVRAIEEELGWKPTTLATCPNCARVWKEKKAG